MSYINAIQYLDDLGATRAVNFVGRGLRVMNQDYLLALAEGDLQSHAIWSKIGYTPTMTTTDSDLWGAAGSYVFPTAETQTEVVSTDNTQDIGTSIRYGTTTNGTKFALEDTTADFTAATAVEVGDCVILDKTLAVPEWGYVTQVFSPTILIIDGGFSERGSAEDREYEIVDKSAYTGAQVVYIEYLDGTYSEKKEIFVLNGTTPVDSANINFFRVNAFRVVAAGSGNKAKGSLAIRHISGSPNYSYILAGYTRARNSIFTVPNGKSIYIVQICAGYGYSTNQTHYSRLYLRANIEPSTGFRTGSIFHPLAEVICANTSQEINLRSPMRIDEKIDIKTSGISTFSGVATMVLRGWIETE